MILMASCGSKEQYIGAYQAEAMDWPKQAETILELKADGGGIWRVRDEEVPFSWYTKGGELRVNTREGGVIAGTIENDTIHITLPGSKPLSFKRIQ
ncbi:MAG: hypothetical protein HGB17_15755 [Syntrophobacteraceae bacterium]|nr:hypothetical protein [Syntrophobacteraceae bacterium]